MKFKLISNILNDQKFENILADHEILALKNDFFDDRLKFEKEIDQENYKPLKGRFFTGLARYDLCPKNVEYDEYFKKYHDQKDFLKITWIKKTKKDLLKDRFGKIYFEKAKNFREKTSSSSFNYQNKRPSHIENLLEKLNKDFVAAKKTKNIKSLNYIINKLKNLSHDRSVCQFFENNKKTKYALGAEIVGIRNIIKDLDSLREKAKKEILKIKKASE